MNKLTSAMKSFIKDFIEDESGLTAVEYAIAGGLVVGGMVGAFVALGDNATSRIQSLSCAVQGGGTYSDEIVAVAETSPGAGDAIDQRDAGCY